MVNHLDGDHKKSKLFCNQLFFEDVRILFFRFTFSMNDNNKTDRRISFNYRQEIPCKHNVPRRSHELTENSRVNEILSEMNHRKVHSKRFILEKLTWYLPVYFFLYLELFSDFCRLH